jgi:hypothetical protein
LVTIVDVRPLTRVRDLDRPRERPLTLKREQVRRPGQDDVLALAVVQATQDQPVGVRVRHHLEHRAHDDPVAVPGQARDHRVEGAPTAVPLDLSARHRQAHKADGLDLQPGQRKPARQLLDR